MLSFFRRVMSSWVVLALLGLLLVAVAVTGIGDPFAGGGPPAGSLVKVGDKTITETDFARQFDRFMRRAREQNPNVTNAQAAQQGAVEQLVEQLSAAAALDQFGRKHGLGISDRAVDAEIAAIPAFQLGGKFDQATYERVLGEQRVTTAELRSDLRSSAVTRQILAPISLGAQAPRTLVEPYAALLLEARRGSIAAIPASQFAPKRAPTAAEVNGYYKANLARYTIPERRSLRFALLSKADLAAEAQPTAAEIKAYYDANKEAYGGVEQRALSQVVTTDRKIAQTIIDRVSRGENFAAVAQAVAGYAAADLALGQQTEAKLAAATSAAVAKAAFAAPAGTLAGPIQSDFGWHVLRVDGVAPVRVRPLVSVSGEISAILRGEKADDLLAKRVADIEDALTQGESFADVVKTHRLTIVSTPSLTRTGLAEDQRYRPDAVTSALLPKAFDADPGEEASVQELDNDRFAVLEVSDTIAAAPAPLTQIQPLVAAQWAQAQAMIRTKAEADAIVAEVGKGVSLAAALSKRGLKAPQSVAGRRIDLGRDGKPVPPPLALLFSIPDGSARALAAPQDQGYFVVKVEEVRKAPATADLNILGGMQSQISKSVPDELAAQFARAVEKDVGVKRSAKTIAAIRARMAGQGVADQGGADGQ